MRYPLLFTWAVVALWSCKDDDPVAPGAPQTRLFVEEINLTGEDRLRSQVTLNWLGEDADGVVVGYEIAVNDTTSWTFVTTTDSVFQFIIPAGEDTTDVLFWVRAVDNDGLRDQTPAFLRVPLKNSPPTAVFLATQAPTDTVLAVVGFGVSANDPDGFETLQTLEFRVNNGSWYEVPLTTRQIHLVPTTPETAGAVTANVYLDNRVNPEPVAVDGLLLDGSNTLYLRAVDQSDLPSEIDTIESVYVKRKTGEWLVLDNWRNNDARNHYFPAIASSTWGPVDFLDLDDTASVPPIGNLTFERLFGLYDKVFWYAQTGQTDLIEAAESVLLTYLNNSADNNKLLLVFPLPADSETVAISSVPRFAPVAFLPEGFYNATLEQGDAAQPITPQFSAYPDLTNASPFIVNQINPFVVSDAGQAMYTGDLRTNTGAAWNGPSNVLIARQLAPSGNPNLVYSVLPLHLLQNAAATTAFFNQVNADFAW